MQEQLLLISKEVALAHRHHPLTHLRPPAKKNPQHIKP